MLVRVLFFGLLKDITGKSSEECEVAEGSAVRDLLSIYVSRYPRLKDSLTSLAIAVNQQYSGAETALNSGDEVALLPPVSGGSEKTTTPDAPPTPARHAKIVREPIVREPIDTAAVLASLKRGDDGAAVVFEGVVRNQTRGRKTLYLDYEAYEEMALGELESLTEQALKKFQVRDIAAVHRLGRLKTGETSVLIVVASAHRGAAFDACRWLIDTLKQKVPIWKKEYFEDGAVWADGEAFPAEVPRANS
jgi:molybdopterin converting factor subunit 1